MKATRGQLLGRRIQHRYSLAAAAATTSVSTLAAERVILPRRRRHHTLSHPLQSRATAFIIFLQH